MGEMRCEPKPGHVTMMLTIAFATDDTGGIGRCDTEISGYSFSRELQAFLSECQGEYSISPNDLSITFADNRDYVRYVLTNSE